MSMHYNSHRVEESEESSHGEQDYQIGDRIPSRTRGTGGFETYRESQDSDPLDSSTPEGRLEEAEQLMDELTPQRLDLEVHEIKKINDSTIVEKLEDGFIIYDVID